MISFSFHYVIGEKNWTVKQVPGTLHQLSIKLKIIIGPDEN